MNMEKDMVDVLSFSIYLYTEYNININSIVVYSSAHQLKLICGLDNILYKTHYNILREIPQK